MADAPTPDDPPPTAPRDAASTDAPADAGAAGARYGERFGERPIPRGCNPLLFGLVLGTCQFAVSVYFMRSC